MKLLRFFVVLSLGFYFTLPAMAQEDIGYDSNHAFFNGLLHDRHLKPVNLRRYRGNIVLLIFWATWCQRCVKQLKIMDGLAEQAEKKRIIFLPINIDFRGINLVKKAYETYDVTNLRPILDRNGKAVKYLNVSVLPTTIVLDELGINRKLIVGQRKWNVQYVNKIIADIKQQQKLERDHQISDIQSNSAQ